MLPNWFCSLELGVLYIIVALRVAISEVLLEDKSLLHVVRRNTIENKKLQKVRYFMWACGEVTVIIVRYKFKQFSAF